MIKEIIQKLVQKTTNLSLEDFQIEKPKSDYGDYAVNAAFVMAKKLGKSPAAIAGELAEKLNADKSVEFEKIEAAGGYVNFFLSREYLQKTFSEIADAKNFGIGKNMEGKTAMVEYTDPNPFKLFHIGHLMSNAIGEAIVRLYEANGARVIRANYQGDVGLHVAKAIWGILRFELPNENEPLGKKAEFLGKAYATGTQAYEKDEKTKKEIEEINGQVFVGSSNEINRLYEVGRKWSLDYFETIYKKLDTKFDRYYFESEIASEGTKIVRENSNIFPESDGAIIFRGENYGLHTRVFVNKNGLPTYEAKELGLNKKKFEEYPNLNLSIIVTGNEINDYFRVLLKVMELTIPEVASRTRHIGHGMLRLPSGKMSSRTGDVITVESLLEQIETILKEKETEKLDDQSREAIAIGAIKYSILKQSPGRDVIFDFDKSLAVQGDSGPYLQYAYARLNSILTKADNQPDKNFSAEKLTEKTELDLIRHLIDFPEVIEEASRNITPHHLALYIFQLANLANSFYEKNRILTDEDKERLAARLVLVQTVTKTLKNGLNILGIKTLAKI